MGAKSILLSLAAIAVSLADLAGSLDRHDYYRDMAAYYLANSQQTEQGAVCDS